MKHNEQNEVLKMRVRSTMEHQNEGIFPEFLKGSFVHVGKLTQNYVGWYYAEIQGYQTYVPIEFVTDNHLNVNYNPTELNGETGEIFELIQIVHEWAVVKNNQDEIGWYPMAKLVSIM